MNSKLAHLGVVFLVLGAALLLTPSFGFETIASDRPADVDTATDENATIGFEATDESIDNRTDSAALFWLRNNAGQKLTLSNLHQLSIANLAILDDGAGTLLPGDAARVAVECGDFGSTDTVTLTTTVESASGETLTITGASSSTSFLAECSVPSIVWNTTADWDAGTDDRTVSDDVGDRESDTVRLGYPASESGLVSYWPLDEDGGSVAYDETTNVNDGEHVNSPGYGATGLLDSTAYELESTSSEHVRVSDDASLQLSDEDSVSISAWIKIDEKRGTSYTAIVQKANEGYNLQLRNGDEPGFTIHDGSYKNVWSGRHLNAGQWYHLTGTYGGDTATIYVDGTAENTRSDVGQLSDTSGVDLGIGENLVATGREFDGRIEEVRLYDRALSAEEVDDLYYTADNGTHTTDWRSTDGALKVDDLFVQNVSATLGGTDATLYVESDTDGDGTVNETSDPISIADDTTEYEVTGLTTDTDRVRLRAEFATANVSRTPILSRVGLVEKHPNFDVAIDDTNQPVVEGETLTVDVTVTNTGYDPGTQTIALRDLDGTVVDSTELSLDVDASESTTLTWPTEAGDAGSGDVNVTSEDDSDTASVAVQRPANFTVAIDGTNSYVTAGEVLRVDATITNEGDASATQAVTLSTDGTERDDQSITLGGGASESITLEWATTDDDVGIYDAAVASEDDSAATEVSVVDPDGPTWETDADWSDGATPNRTVSDDVGDRENDTVRLGYPADSTGIVSYWPFDEDTGSTATDVVGGNDGDHVGSGIALGNPGLLNTSRYQFDGSSHVTVSDDASLQLQGDFTVSVWIRADGTLGNSDDGSGMNEVFFVDKGNYDGGHGYQLIDNGDHDSASNAIKFRVHDGGNHYEVTLPRSDVDDGSWHHLTGVRDGDEIRLYLDGESRGSQSGTSVGTSTDDLYVGGSENDDRHLDGDVDELRIYDRALSDAEVRALAGTADAGSHTTDWRPTGAPLDTAHLQLENVSVATGAQNATVYVESDTDHDGTVDETSDAIALVDGDTAYNVAGLATDPDRVRLRIEFDTGDPAVSSIVSRVAVAERTNFEVQIDGTNAPVLEGENLTVDATVDNTGDREGTQTIELQDFDGAVVDSTDVTLASGENTSITLTWATQTGDNGTGNVTVASDDQTASREVTVEQPAYFATAIDATNSPVVEGSDLDVNVTVTNEGDYAGTQTVELRDFDGTVVDATEVSLDAGQSNSSITLTWATEVGDAGTGDVTVASDNTTATQAVTVESEGTVSATNVASNVSSGEDTQYFEFEINTSVMSSDDRIEINVSEADNAAAMDYLKSDGSSVTVVSGGTYVKNEQWKDLGTSDQTGPRMRLTTDITDGATVNVSVTEYSTDSSGGPWSVTFRNMDDSWEETDDFEISG